MSGLIHKSGVELDDLYLPADKYAAKLGLLANHAIVDSTHIPFDRTYIDRGNMADLVNGRIYAPIAGIYLVVLSLHFLSVAPGNGAYFQIRQNGTNTEISIIRRNWNTGFMSAGGPFASQILDMGVNDFVDVIFIGTANGCQLRAGGQVGSHFSLVKL